jgi:hypothetical protein
MGSATSSYPETISGSKGFQRDARVLLTALMMLAQGVPADLAASEMLAMSATERREYFWLQARRRWQLHFKNNFPIARGVIRVDYLQALEDEERFVRREPKDNRWVLEAPDWLIAIGMTIPELGEGSV